MKTTMGTARLGFGCAAIPGPLTTRQAQTLLETAYACGVRHFDTARMYCGGTSEAVLGELIRQRLPDMTIVTKAGIAPVSPLARRLSKITPGLPRLGAPRVGQFRPDQIRRSVETSLRKLKLERIDALLLHEVRAAEIGPELIALLETLRREGKIGAFGIATSIEESEAIIAAHPELCAIVQVSAGWFDRPRVLPENTRLIVHSVLGARLASFLAKLRASDQLARRFKEETSLTPDDVAKIGRLMLQAAMLRNAHGLTLFSTSRLERVRYNAELLGAKLDTNAVHALERTLRPPETAREAAP